MENLHAHMHQPDLSGQKEIVNEKKNWMIDEALCGKMNGTLQFNRKMGATAMSEGLSDESYHGWRREVGCAPIWNYHPIAK